MMNNLDKELEELENEYELPFIFDSKSDVLKDNRGNVIIEWTHWNITYGNAIAFILNKYFEDKKQISIKRQLLLKELDNDLNNIKKGKQIEETKECNCLNCRFVEATDQIVDLPLYRQGVKDLFDRVMELIANRYHGNLIIDKRIQEENTIVEDTIINALEYVDGKIYGEWKNIVNLQMENANLKRELNLIKSKNQNNAVENRAKYLDKVAGNYKDYNKLFRSYAGKCANLIRSLKTK